MSSRRFFCLLGAFAVIFAFSGAQAAPLDPQQVYVKKATWAETMLAARAKCAAWTKDAKEGQETATALQAVWTKLRADWPAQAAWFQQDLPRGRHFDWFLQAGNTNFEQWIMGRARARRVLERIGVADTGPSRELADLIRGKVPPSDTRWLELYARTRRFEDALDASARVGLLDLRVELERQAKEMILAKVTSDDSRWIALTRWAGRCIVPGRVVNVGKIAQLRTAVDVLANALPGRITAGSALSKQLANSEPKWSSLAASLGKQDAEALASLPAVAEEIRAARQSLVRLLAGMPEFLDRWKSVSLEAEWETQFLSLRDDLGDRAWFDRVGQQTQRADSLILAGDRDQADVVLRRTAALLANVKRMGGSPDLADAERHLSILQKAAAAIDPDHSEARYVLYADACRVRRQIAFRNPLLNFGELLFVKRHRAIYPHMCDQYYGIAARPGGGVYVLSNPFAPGTRMRDVLADAVVRRGRLQGQKLSGGPNKHWNIGYDGMGHLVGEETVGGSFLSPDLSYDGKSILFAYVECMGDRNHVHHTDPARGHWAPGRCYHLFRVNADGSSLVQLSDGTWNDFDPRWMPSGRIAFISERRGGYLRCGRVCPTYTLYDMDANGSDIRCLSHHETNEWHPCVAHDGRIAWTRWDYVDRSFSAAHMPWITGVDGRDPRPIHGNYAWRGNRPDMELSLRPIPGSPKFVATAAPHHNQAFGSLILIDPRVRDDDGGQPLKRLTPEVGFPETGEGGTESYGTAWPLSEDYHLCVYDASIRPAQRPAPWSVFPNANYGIYLVDAFGNRELVYRDPAISCHQPIPLVPRKTPPVVSTNFDRLASQGPDEAVVTVVDVYDSLKPWPPRTRISALRVWQLLPLSVAPAPRNMGIQVSGTGSVNTGRAVLGTVPVEADGSAHFVVPAGKEVFFQALDASGLAVQSMRSGTHFMAGERHTCQGCHEPKHRSPLPVSSARLATSRAPSRLSPDVDGTNPFSYPRLVQPVLDKHCVACHAREPNKTPRLDAEPMRVAGKAYMDMSTTYYTSYASLAPKFGFYSYGTGPGRSHRTTPGEFGARASKLYEILAKGHYDVKLRPEELHRITVWLDSCSMFYGVYEVAGGEAQLRGEIVRPTLE